MRPGFRSIPGWPGYFISIDGRVIGACGFELKKRNGQISVYHKGKSAKLKIADLLATIWRDKKGMPAIANATPPPADCWLNAWGAAKSRVGEGYGDKSAPGPLAGTGLQTSGSRTGCKAGLRARIAKIARRAGSLAKKGAAAGKATRQPCGPAACRHARKTQGSVKI